MNEDLNDVKKTITKLFAKSFINMYDESKMISNKLLAKRDSNEFLNKTPLLMILTADNISYQREDNIYVVPITLLKD